MIAKWYRGYQVIGRREDHINNISNLVRQHDLGSIIPCLHIEKFKGRQWQFYLFLGFNTELKGEIPPQVLQILSNVTIGHPVGDFEYAEIRSMVSAGIDTEYYQRTITYRPSVIASVTNPLDLSDLESYNDHQSTPEKLTALNRLLYWLSAVSNGNWSNFKRAYDLLTAAATNKDARYTFRQLRLLGHLEYTVANGSKWAICPPTLVQSSQPDYYFLTGQRTPKLLACVNEYVSLEELPQPTGEAPNLVRLHFTSMDAAKKVITNTPFNLYWAGLACMRLADILPDLKTYQNSLTSVSGFTISNFKLERWQGNNFVETYSHQQTGLYRLTPREINIRLASQTFLFDGVTGQWCSGPWYDLRFLAQQAMNMPCLVQYHHKQQRLAIPTHYRWPDLYERALVLASGLLPLCSPDHNWFYFSDISPKLVETLTNKLNVTVEEVT